MLFCCPAVTVIVGAPEVGATLLGVEEVELSAIVCPSEGCLPLSRVFRVGVDCAETGGCDEEL